jgi:hypothetical protein
MCPWASMSKKVASEMVHALIAHAITLCAPLRVM